MSALLLGTDVQSTDNRIWSSEHAGGPLPFQACFPAHDLLRIVPAYSILLASPWSSIYMQQNDFLHSWNVSTPLATGSLLIHPSRPAKRPLLPLQPSPVFQLQVISLGTPLWFIISWGHLPLSTSCYNHMGAYLVSSITL